MRAVSGEADAGNKGVGCLLLYCRIVVSLSIYLFIFCFLALARLATLLYMPFALVRGGLT